VDRRTFLTSSVCLLAAPLGAEGQQVTVPTIGFLRSTPAEPFAHLVTASVRASRKRGSSRVSTSRSSIAMQTISRIGCLALWRI
jgi:hypothetical protein